jgi:hypothetical protein
MISQHTKIEEYLIGLGVDTDELLDLNDLDSFKDCAINKSGAVYFTKDGRVLKGSPSPNKSGRSKKAATEQLQQDKQMQSVLDQLRATVATNGILTEEEAKIIMSGLVLNSKTTNEIVYNLSKWAQYFIGKKQTIESEPKEDRKLVITFGDVDTTKLLLNVTPEETKEGSDEQD